MIININDNQFKVKLAKTEKQIRDGMMFSEFNNKFNGMLFFMGNGEHCFWMKNCKIKLDIIFIKNGKISKIYHDCPPCNFKDDDKCKRYCGIGNFVLELPGGTCELMNIKKGDDCDLIKK